MEPKIFTKQRIWFFQGGQVSIHKYSLVFCTVYTYLTQIKVHISFDFITLIWTCWIMP